MIFDTDVMIWYMRGNDKAFKAIDESDRRTISIMTYMELIQGARDKKDQSAIRETLSEFSFQTLPITENIAHRAAIYMEEHCMKVSLCPADAIIAATAVEMDISLCTANNKHFKVIEELDIKLFRP